MSNADAFGFGKFVPGFDFLQNLSQAAKQAQPANPAGADLHGFSPWFTPNMSVEDLEKRIGELKTVQFWLEQNARVLAATIQALEVQKMTLATLNRMDFGLGTASTSKESAAKAKSPANTVDPVQLWSALSQQFQTIASTAMDNVNKAAAQQASPIHPAASASAKAKSRNPTSATRRSSAKKTSASQASTRKRPPSAL